MQNNTKPSMLNKICAHPLMVSWVLGACALYAFMIGSILSEVPLLIIATDLKAMLYLFIINLIPATLLGFFIGWIMLSPLIAFVCSKLNGAPFKPGDQVLILSGPHKGIITEVSEITRGQGGWKQAIILHRMGEKEEFTGTFEEYELLKIGKNEQEETANPEAGDE